jgi:uncharacterized metal-binding protein YceD (DUF177 family)
MRVEFSKIKGEKSFILEKNGVEAIYTLKPKNRELLFCSQKITGKIETLCNRCGAEIVVDIDEDSQLLISNGIYNGFDDELDIIEADKGVIDFDEILYGELQLIESGYYYCSNCKENETEEIVIE